MDRRLCGTTLLSGAALISISRPCWRKKLDGNGFVDTRQMVGLEINTSQAVAKNTTIGLVATNTSFTKTEMTKVAQMAQDALARTIYPAHTPGDGDTVFALATGTSEASVQWNPFPNFQPRSITHGTNSSMVVSP